LSGNGFLFDTSVLIWWLAEPSRRLLIAQAVEENITLVSVDPLMRDYPVAVLV
jgi:PIN domain nuclease of toxin-antitoxin system